MSVAFISSSSGSFKKERCTMEFGSIWGEGQIFDWYRALTSKIVTRLEVRISRDAVPHRFVVAYMQDNSILRFDRRPKNPNLFVIAAQTAVVEEASRAADEACVVDSLGLLEIEMTSHWEIDLNLPANVDVLLVLSACFAIAQDEKARNYALREYNCYFFSWTIVMLVTRHLLPFIVPTPAAVESRWKSRLVEGSARISDIIVKALLEIVLDTVAAIDSVTGTRLHSGLSKRELAVWGLPMPMFRALLRQCLKILLHCGLKKKLDEQVRLQLENRAVPVLQGLLGAARRDAEESTEGNGGEVAQNGVADRVQHGLWLNDLLTDLKEPVKEEVLQILWDSILEAISEGYSDVKVDTIQEGIRGLPLLQRLKHYLFGKNVIQFSQIWSEALRAALPAARKAGHGKYQRDKTHGEMFDMAFKAGADEALRAAKEVVQKTGPALANPKRDKMWDYVWSVWEEIWELGRTATQAKIVAVVESTLEEIVGWVAEDVVKELGESEGQKVQATIQFKVRTSLVLRDSIPYGGH
ncbi:hypothetical protein FRC07_006472 [Ceratobasidium sp. 392]|nr:hypothetical protein FRC07_006472 [Ceratobasidium sp. 392]